MLAADRDTPFGQNGSRMPAKRGVRPALDYRDRFAERAFCRTRRYLARAPGRRGPAYIPLHIRGGSASVSTRPGWSRGRFPLMTALAALKPLLEEPARSRSGIISNMDWLVLARYGIETAPGRRYHADLYVLIAGARRPRHMISPNGIWGKHHQVRGGAGAARRPSASDRVGIEEATSYAAEMPIVTMRLSRVSSAAGRRSEDERLPGTLERPPRAGDPRRMERRGIKVVGRY